MYHVKPRTIIVKHDKSQVVKVSTKSFNVVQYIQTFTAVDMKHAENFEHLFDMIETEARNALISIQKYINLSVTHVH